MLLFSFGKHDCTHMCNVLFSCFTWNTVRMAAGKVSKFVVGVSSSKLNLKRIHNNIITNWKKTTTPKPLEQMLKTRFQSGLNGLYLQFRKVTWINGIKKKESCEERYMFQDMRNMRAQKRTDSHCSHNWIIFFILFPICNTPTTHTFVLLYLWGHSMIISWSQQL